MRKSVPLRMFFCVSALLLAVLFVHAKTYKMPVDNEVRVLPQGSSPLPESVPHFPSPLYAYVWRNWNLVELNKLARIVHATPDEINLIARSMGLPRYRKPTWHVNQIYITLIRRNWHLLPYEQLLSLVEMTSERLNFVLKEDDFLWVKLGYTKPKCEPVYYVKPTVAELERAAEIKHTLHEWVGDNILPVSTEARFAFVNQLKKTKLRVDKLSGRKQHGSLRFIYSYFGLYGDPLSDDNNEIYPDGLLQRLSAMGVNGVWLHALLRTLAPGGEAFPEFGEGCEKRLHNLRKLVSRARKYGIAVYLYMNEPRAMPASFFQQLIAGRMEMRGVREGDYYALCTSTPEVRNWLKEALAYVFKEVPQLGGVFTITGSENLTFCNSHGGWRQCLRCSQKAGAEVVAEVNRLMAEGVHRSAPDAKVIVWDWGWGEAEDIIRLLPDDVWLMSVSEWGMPINRGDVQGTVGEYSLSTVGPGPVARHHWQLAQEKGMKTVAKVQFNCAWEIAAVPYVPVMDLIAEHCHNLTSQGVDGFMLSWTLGGYPSPNLEIPEQFHRTPVPTVDEALDSFAAKRCGKAAAPLVRQAWSVMSEVYREYPFNVATVYTAPVQMGPANLFRLWPTGYHATMVGFPYDDVRSWCSNYPPAVFASLFDKMSRGFSEGVELMKKALLLVADKEQQANLKRDIRYAKAVQIHFASVANQVNFILLRDAYHADGVSDKALDEIRQKLLAIVDREIKLTKDLYILTLEDSCIGFEASNQYFYVPNDLLEKLISCRQVKEELMGMTAFHLTCEYLENPIALDTKTPRFGWKLQSSRKNEVQTAYELIVSDNPEKIQQSEGNVWSTGVVSSREHFQIAYEGASLQSFKRYYWRVRVYDKTGKASAWSRTAWFETAMLDAGDWKAHWISDGNSVPAKTADFYKEIPAPLFKKEFRVEKKIAFARLYITGLGYYEAYINGQTVGDHCLDPGWTTYSKQVLYVGYDITAMLKQGGNAIGVMLGNGWYNPLPLNMWCSPRRNLRDYLDTGIPALKAQLRICYDDGMCEEIVTDASWATAPGPIVKNNVYLGEHYDARREQRDWAVAGSVLKESKPAVVIDGPEGLLTVQMQPPVKVIEVVHPVAIKQVSPNVYIVDMGMNFAGVARIKVKGKAGTTVRLRYGEDIYSDGTLNGMTAIAGQIKGCDSGDGAPRYGWQIDTYTLRGDSLPELWSPRFTFHGFRYIEIKGWPGVPVLESIEGLRMSADVAVAGTFESSNEMFNTLYRNIDRTCRSNMFSVQSDCPTREKYSYGGDMACSAEAFLFNYDMSAFYRKMVTDYQQAQRPLGGITETAPYVGIADDGPGDRSGPLGFQIGYSFIIDRLYEFYGDKRIISEHYPYVKKQLDFLISCAKGDLYSGGLSDHESLDRRPFAFTESLFYLHHLNLFVKYARILGKGEDERAYSAIARRVKTKVKQTFYHPESGYFADSTQTAQLFGLGYGLVEGHEKTKALQTLRQTFEVRNRHLSTGIFGTKLMFDVLSCNKMDELLYEVANQRDFPGWGYMISRGATSLWETWNYSDNTYSQNHPMFGSIVGWFYRSLLGINPASTGFKKILIAPRPAGDLTYARGSYQSIQGEIRSGWKIEGGKITLNVSIPVGTEARILLPTSPRGETKEYKVGSGDYTFQADYHI